MGCVCMRVKVSMRVKVCVRECRKGECMNKCACIWGENAMMGSVREKERRENTQHASSAKRTRVCVCVCVCVCFVCFFCSARAAGETACCRAALKKHFFPPIFGGSINAIHTNPIKPALTFTEPTSRHPASPTSVLRSESRMVLSEKPSRKVKRDSVTKSQAPTYIRIDEKLQVW